MNGKGFDNYGRPIPTGRKQVSLLVDLPLLFSELLRSEVKDEKIEF